MNSLAADPDEQPKLIQFDLEDRDTILSLYTVELDIENRFKLATLKGKGILVQLNAYDLDELLGSIAAVANHEKDSKLRRKLDALYYRVNEKLETQFPK